MPASCHGVCSRHAQKKPRGRPEITKTSTTTPKKTSLYAMGLKFCLTCNVWLKWDGRFCMCCGVLLRTTPRTSAGKRALREVRGLQN